MAARGTPPLPSAPPAATPVGAAPLPRIGSLEDRGVARRDAVHALTWTVSGSARVLGNVDVGSGRTDGAVTVGGTLAADRFRADGSLEVSGALRIAETLEVRGTLRTLAAVRAGDLVLGGTTHAMATLVADRVLRFQGSLAAPSLRAGAVEGRGAMEVPGDIEAWRVAVDLSAASHLGTVRAHIAQLHSKVPNPVEKVLGREVLVTIDRVEADEVELIGVDVGYVRSPQVTLGRGCHVTTVEGTIVAQHASADVGPRSKSPPPHGLRR